MDKNWFYTTLIIWLLFIFGNIMCQVEYGPIGAHRIYEKTSFSCAGRSNGYYADIETGCQIYHMCDGLGRQFTYSCPNTTLFQQRMLICDHWYMVNCSRAESDYTANLLIGQRDKPFVPDDENQQRTPRPDLLDRPYAPDYSGESFRNQYKQIPPVPNQIDDSNQDIDSPPQNVHIQLNPPPSSTRWRIAQPSQEILPPAIAPIVVGVRRMDEIDETGNIDLGTSFSSHYNSSADVSIEDENLQLPITIRTTSAPLTTYPTTTTSTTTTTRRTTTNFQKRPTKLTESNIIGGNIKTPSKLYEPPFLYPIYNENYTETDTDTDTEKYTTSTASPFIIASTTARPPPPPLTRPTTSAGRPFSHTFRTTTQIPTTFRISTIQLQSTESLEQAESSSSIRSNFNNYDFSRYVTTTTTQKPNTPTTEQQRQELNDRQQQSTVQPIVVSPIESEEEQHQETPTSDEQYYSQNESDIKKIVPNNLQLPIQENRNDASSILDFNIPTNNKLALPSPFTNKYNKAKTDIQQPPSELLPPFLKFIEYDIATTQGPPIYYEWKIPSNALEPPKLDPPIGVDGRLTPDYLTGDDGEIDNPIENQNQQVINENSSAQIDEHAVQEEQLQQGSFGQKIHPDHSSNNNNNDQQLQGEQSEKSFSSSQSPPQPIDNFQFAHNPFLASLATKSQRSVDSETRVSPTARSISTSRLNDLDDNKISTTRKPPTELEIQQLKRDLLVPDFLFPLEEIGRTGYEVSDTFNSFQLKIPKRKSDNKGKNWYGENIKCPECHPSFVKPGTCEPCVKRR